MTPPKLKPMETSSLKGHVPSGDQKLNDAIGRNGELIWRQQHFWSSLGALPPTATSTSGFTSDVLVWHVASSSSRATRSPRCDDFSHRSSIRVVFQ